MRINNTRAWAKNVPYRNQFLRDLADKMPVCGYCGKPKDGTIVLCHSNRQKDGHGTGVKAHDIPAYGCKGCHDLADGRVYPDWITREKQDSMVYEMAYNSMLWILRSGDQNKLREYLKTIQE